MVNYFSCCKTFFNITLNSDSVPKLLMDPKCKSAVITGGVSGIGLATASHLLNVGGRKVVIMGKDCCQGREAESFLNRSYGKDKAAFMKVDLLDLKGTEGVIVAI